MTPLPAEALPPECMEGTFNSHGFIPLAITILGLFFAISALTKAFQWLREETDARRNKTTPPDHRTAKAWLLIEDIFLYRPFGKPACFDFFRHAQHLVTTGWLATLAVLTLLYFGKEILS